MPAFHYSALDSGGRERRGVIEADTARQARTSLRAQGLFPVAIDAIVSSAAQPGRQRSRIPAARLAGLTRQWATLLEAGIPLDQSLSALQAQAASAGEHAVLAGIRAEVLAGHRLSAALTRFDTVFSAFYRALIESGEKSGQLAEVMERLADHLESMRANRAKLLQTTLYPAIIIIVAFLVVIGLMTYVVPQVVAVFQHGHQSLPLLTRGLIALSDFLRLAGIPLLFLLIGGGFAFFRALRREPLRFSVHSRLLRTPLLGELLRTQNSARFAQTVAIVVSSSGTLLLAMEAARRVVSLLPMRRAIEQGERQLKEGVSLSRALADTGMFPPLLLHMIASGEQSGRLPEMLARAARQQQTDLDSRVATLMTIIEPILILVMGIVVLIIVLAILQPIIEINQFTR